MKIVVLNTVLSNAGDAAIYQAITEALQAAGLCTPESITAFDSSAEITGGLYPGWHVVQQPGRSSATNKIVRRVSNAIRGAVIAGLTRFSGLRRAVHQGHSLWPRFSGALRALEEADLVLSSGGTYLVDHYNFAHRVRELRLSRALGKPVVLWTQSAGPFSTTRARRLIEQLTPEVDGIFFRDTRSRNAWESVAPLPALSKVAPDCVFGMSTLDMPERPPSLDGEAPLALLSVREWKMGAEGGELNFDSYREAMRAVAEELISCGWRCTAISTCQGVPQYPVDDSRTAREIFEGLNVEIDGSFHTPGQLLERISEADLVISTRMHLAILSLISRTPVVAVAYEPKTLELFKSIDYPDAVVSIERADAPWARSLFVDDDPRVRAAVLSEEALENLRLRAREPAELLSKIVRERVLNG